MKLTDAEYQKFKTQFYCTAWPDEQYRIPVDVETPDGNRIWTAYIEGARFHAEIDWVRRLRGNPSGLVNASMITAPANTEPIRYAFKAQARVPRGRAVSRPAFTGRTFKLDLTAGLMVVLLLLCGIYIYASRYEPARPSIHKQTANWDAAAVTRTNVLTSSEVHNKGR